MPLLSRRAVEFFSPADPIPYVISDGSYEAPFLLGASGLGMPTYAVGLISTPGVTANRLRNVVAKPNVISIPMLIHVESYPQLRRERDRLMNALDPESGVGILRVTSDLATDMGDLRQCPAVYIGGLEGDETLGVSGPTFWRPVLKFQALDIWSSPEPTTARWSGKQGVPFLPFSLPFALSPYGVEETDPLELGGNVRSWPTYTLSGPWSRVRFTNNRSGHWWQVARGSQVGEALIVKTKPGEVSVRTESGLNAYGLLDPKSDLFALNPDDTLSVEADGADASTVFDLEVPVAWRAAP